METLFHQLKDQRKRPRGIRKKNTAAYESVLNNTRTDLLEVMYLFTYCYESKWTNIMEVIYLFLVMKANRQI